MPRKTSSSRTGARRLPKMLNYTPTAINYTPTTDNQVNNPGTPQVGPQENFIWNNEDPPKVHVPHYKFTLMHYTTPNGPYLDHHPVTHHYCIHTRDLGNKLPHTTNICGTDGKTQKYQGWVWLTTAQGLPWEKPHPYAIHAKRVMVAPSGKTGKLCHPPRGNWTSAGNDQQYHDPLNKYSRSIVLHV